MSKSTQADCESLKRTMRYLRGTVNLGLQCLNGSSLILVTFSDADYAGDIPSYRSTSGQVTLFAGAPISWRSELQEKAVTSTTEAEFCAATKAIKSLLCIKDIDIQLEVIDDKPVPLYCDNAGAVLIASNERSVQRARHIGADSNYAREANETGVITIRKCKAEDQLADMLTKPLRCVKFAKNRDRLMAHMTLSIICFLGVVSPVLTENATLVEADSTTTLPHPRNWVDPEYVSYLTTVRVFDVGCSVS